MIQIAMVEELAVEMAVAVVEQDHRGHCMKLYNICLISILILSAGCSIKKKEQAKVSVNLLEQLRVLPDSDNDGISDEIESQTGTNPFIADIPRLSIGLVRDIEIGAIFRVDKENFLGSDFLFLKQEFTETSDEGGGDLNFLKVLRKKVVINQYNHLRNVKTEKSDIIVNEDLRANILSSWDDGPFYKFLNDLPEKDRTMENTSGKFLANFKIELNDLKNVTEVSDISLKSYFYNYESMTEAEIYDHFLIKESGYKERFKLSGNDTYTPITVYPLIANELSSTDILEKINERNELGIKFSDYSYMLSGVALNYKEVMDKVFDGNAKIIFSNGKKTEVYFVSPSLTIENVLAQKGHKVILNKFGEVYSIDGQESLGKYPLDLDSITKDDLKRGIWSVFGDADSLAEQLKARGTYVVSYSSVEEILNAGKKWVQLSESEFVNKLELSEVYEGDELLFELDEQLIQYVNEAHEPIYIPEYCSGSGCNFAEDIDRGKTCNCTPACNKVTSRVVVNESPLEIKANDVSNYFEFSDSYGNQVNAAVFKYGNKIRIKFMDLKIQLKNKITIKFKDSSKLVSTARSGLIASSCSSPAFSSQSYENQFKLKGTLKIYGINKY
jgi:hypothetical protein